MQSEKDFQMAQSSLEQLTANLLDVFEQFVPRSELDEFDTGHARIFSGWIVVWLMVYQRIHKDAPLSSAMAEMLLGVTSRRLPECKRVLDGKISANTGAYSQARSDLPVEAASRAANLVSQTIVENQGPAWKGRHALIFDGTSVSVGHYPELVLQFPPATNQHGQSHWPVIKLVVVHELCSGLAMRPQWGPMYGPNAVSETELAQRSLKELGDPAMIIYDRNFGIFSMTYAAVAGGHDVLTRMTDTRFQSLVTKAKPIGPGQWTLEWCPSRWDRLRSPELPVDALVCGRLIEAYVEPHGKTINLRLFTTDMTSSVEELVALYGRRWSIEGDIRDLKQTLAMDRLSGQSVDIITKEILLGMVAYNLVIQVRRLAGKEAAVEPRRLSFGRILHLVQAFCNGLGSGTTIEEQEERFKKLLKAAGQCRHPRRQRSRSYPREVIPRGRRFPERVLK
jgi:putative transposase